MKAIKQFFKSFSLIDLLIWSSSVIAIVLSFVLTKNTDYLQLAASLIGACSLIIIAKGNVVGQILSVVFSVFYGVISFYYRYYGELATYGMTGVMAIGVIIAWLRHPFQGKKTEVTVNTLKPIEHPLLIVIALVLTVPGYLILRALDTPNLWCSTLSVLTSLVAILYTLRRSPYYALGYALNDIVLIVLWALMAQERRECIAMVVCFAVFLFIDFYSLVNWLRLRKRQEQILDQQKFVPSR